MRVKRKDWLDLLLYLFLLTTIFILTSRLTDLPVGIDNWQGKVFDLYSGKWPEDNFYPAGSAILMMPFRWLFPHFLLICYFYFLAGALLFRKLVLQFIHGKKNQWITLCFLICNPYLIWLVISSQDTVFELFLLGLTLSAVSRGKFLSYAFAGTLLCLTRPSYWILFFVLTIPLIRVMKNKDFLSSRSKWFLSAIPIVCLSIVLSLNFLAWGKLFLAGESGVTFLFSHNKYQYLSLPKFDMDVFLSTGGHMNAEAISANSNAFSWIDDKELRAGLISIKDNPKQFLLAQGQKLDSYFFVTEKVPALPGEYYLDEESKRIIIGDERLKMPIVLGNTVYTLYRSTWLVLFLLAIGITLKTRGSIWVRFRNFGAPGALLLPYLCGVVPGLLFYTETRFKIISELFVAIWFIAVFSEKNQDNIKELI